MKQWIIIWVAILQLASTTQFSQLYKLPVFISHYLEHSNNTFNFDELKIFIVHHYGGHEMDEDWETDQKLPFMNADRVHLDPCYISDFNFNLSPEIFEKISLPQTIWKNQIITFPYLNSIWEPPKFA
ncbi:hypothetical protein [Flavobacterium sp. I3-2]|uniref:hypothetical protein n=1 Tax=Flavobacterium sp. I3-2 TaxID=2748319 RepID=UPI0015AA01DC|nr:hypothetical protein [Flavobacterium sp. I3-2]